MPNSQDSPRFNIPENITRDHIIQAINEIDIKGYSEKNASRKYNILYNGKRYPPKVVISLSNKFANGPILEFSEFSGGEQFTNKFLKERGFEISLKNEDDSDFEYESYSWKIISNLIATKKMDKSSFLRHGTGIPVEIRSFFNIDAMKVGDDRREITLSLGTSNFKAHFEILNKNNPRTRLLWRSDFQHFIQNKFPEWVDYFHKHSKHDDSTPILKLQKTELPDKYVVFFEDSEKPTLPVLYTHSSTDGVYSQSPVRENKIPSEYTHRMQIWNHLQEHYKSTNVLPDILREEYRIYRGAAGIWYDKERTTRLSDDGNGITVSVLHTGKSYPDDVGKDSIIYHYPTTNRSGNSDQNEINATKNCKKYHLPLFIITHSKENEKMRDVQLGYVVDWNDDNRTFLINFSESEPIIEPSLPMVADTPFDWTQQRKQKTTTTTSPQRNPVFRFNVLKRYGSKCAVCSIKIDNLLSASHIIPVGEKGGSDDERNGLVLCHNHHRAFDDFLFSIDPVTNKLVFMSKGPSMNELKIETECISPIRNAPHVEALRWRRDKFREIREAE